MSEDKTKLEGPDLEQGVESSMIPNNDMLLGHARGEPVILVRRGDELFAIGAVCTHYGAPLEQGLIDGDLEACDTVTLWVMVLGHHVKQAAKMASQAD